MHPLRNVHNASVGVGRRSVLISLDCAPCRPGATLARVQHASDRSPIFRNAVTRNPYVRMAVGVCTAILNEAEKGWQKAIDKIGARAV